jgi:threonine-phosphate decarboxylase
MKTNRDIPPHGGQLHQIAERFGIPERELLDFSANINPEGPPASVIQALHEALRDPAVLSRYPDLEETQLRLSISNHVNVLPECITVANGFVPLLDAVLRALPIRRCLLPVPAFGEYRNALERSGAAATPYALDQQKGFRYQPDDLLAELATGHYDSILLANPQNPSGVLCERANLIAFIEESARLNIYVLLDEAFIDYAPVQSTVNGVERFANLVVFRSVTKFHGIPGMRVAYAVAGREITRIVRQKLSPWSITTLAAIAVRAALSDAAYAERTLQLNAARREGLTTQIKALGLHTYHAAANFLLIRFHSDTEARSCWEQLIFDDGVVLRRCTNFEGLSHDHLRCAVLDEERNSRLVKALNRQRMLNRLVD